MNAIAYPQSGGSAAQWGAQRHPRVGDMQLRRLVTQDPFGSRRPLPQSRERSCTFSGGHRIARRLPRVDASLEGLGVREALRLVPRCLTGSAPLRRSRTVEDDLLIFRQGGEPGLEGRKRDGPPEPDLAVLGLVLVGAHQQRLVGRRLSTRFLNADPFDFRHIYLLVLGELPG